MFHAWSKKKWFEAIEKINYQTLNQISIIRWCLRDWMILKSIRISIFVAWSGCLDKHHRSARKTRWGFEHNTLNRMSTWFGGLYRDQVIQWLSMRFKSYSLLFNKLSLLNCFGFEKDRETTLNSPLLIVEHLQCCVDHFVRSSEFAASTVTTLTTSLHWPLFHGQLRKFQCTGFTII